MRHKKKLNYNECYWSENVKFELLCSLSHIKRNFEERFCFTTEREREEEFLFALFSVKVFRREIFFFFFRLCYCCEWKTKVVKSLITWGICMKWWKERELSPSHTSVSSLLSCRLVLKNSLQDFRLPFHLSTNRI